MVHAKQTTRLCIVKKFHAILTLIFLILLIFVVVIIFSFIITLKSRKIFNNCNSTSTLAIKSENNHSIQLIEIIKLNYRLPLDIKPYFYDLTIFTTFNDVTAPDDYIGIVKIDFKCFKETDKVILHGKDLYIFNKTVKVSAVMESMHQDITIRRLDHDYEREFLIIELNNQLTANLNYTISIKYQGYFKDDNVGFYRSFYFDNQGTKRYDLFFFYYHLRLFSCLKMACGISNATDRSKKSISMFRRACNEIKI